MISSISAITLIRAVLRARAGMRFWPLFLRLCSAGLWLPGVLLLLLSIPIRRWGGWTALCCSLLSRAGPGSLVAPDQAPRPAARLARSGFAHRAAAGFRPGAFTDLPASQHRV